jgi:hypothetical protein
VEWILWSSSTETALIIIPEEAELLIPVIRRAGRQAKVYLIAYAAPVTKSMVHFNGLSYYTLPHLPTGYSVPEWLSIELGIFAGRLYIDFAECAPLEKYLQLSGGAMVAKDLPSNGELQAGGSIFTKNPVSFLLEWLTLRRKSQDIMHTPMGYICQGRPLHEGHPFFVTRRADAQEAVAPPLEVRRTDGDSEDGVDDEDSEMDDDPMDLDIHEIQTSFENLSL